MSLQRSIKVLIVEDEFITARAIEESLISQGYEVVGIVPSGTEAVEMAVHQRPDVVLMDIKLRGFMDGISVTQRIQPILDIPVIYLTAHSDTETLKRVIHSKPYGYIVKPFTEKELHTAIETALERHKTRRNR